jgi:hypothetical protein
VSKLGNKTRSFSLVCLLCGMQISHIKLCFCRVPACGPPKTFLLSFVCSPNWGGLSTFPTVLPGALCCFFYKFKIYYFWISPGLLTVVCCYPPFPFHAIHLLLHLMFCFRFMEMQESADCLNLPSFFPFLNIIVIIFGSAGV